MWGPTLERRAHIGKTVAPEAASNLITISSIWAAFGTRKPVLKLRRIEPGDLDRIGAIEQASFPIDAYSRSHLMRLYHQNPDGFIVAERDGRDGSDAYRLVRDLEKV